MTISMTSTISLTLTISMTLTISLTIKKIVALTLTTLRFKGYAILLMLPVVHCLHKYFANGILKNEGSNIPAKTVNKKFNVMVIELPHHE